MKLDKPQSYKEYKQELKEKQAGMTRDQIIAEMQGKAEVVEDLNNLPSVQHRWVHRGIVMSCEHAGHPNHRHFLVGRSIMNT